jgi:hypothetical protein
MFKNNIQQIIEFTTKQKLQTNIKEDYKVCGIQSYKITTLPLEAKRGRIDKG